MENKYSFICQNELKNDGNKEGVPSEFWRLMINLGQCNISHSYSITCRNKVSDQQGVRPKSDPSGLQLSGMHM